MMEEWSLSTIGEVCVLRSGTTLPKEIEKPAGEIPYLKVADMNLGDNLNGITSSSRYVNKNDVNASNLLPVGTTIFPKRGGAILTNKKRLTERVICADLNIMGVTPKARLLPEYVFYYFLNLDLGEICNGTSIPQINNYTIEPLLISFPKALPEQQRIVTILDEAFDGIATAKAKAEKNLQNARALFESHLQSVFTQRGGGWVAIALENCCAKILAGGDVPKGRVSEERTPQYSVPIYSNGAKNEGLYGFTDVANVMKPSVTISARGTIGFSAIRTEPFLPVVRLIILVPDEETIDLSFLHYAVMGMDFENTGTSIPQLTVPNLRERLIYIPTLTQQRVIVANLDAIRDETQRLEAIYRQKLAALNALKKSLLDQAFTGAL